MVVVVAVVVVELRRREREPRVAVPTVGVVVVDPEAVAMFDRVMHRTPR
jgi:hypothetical protein